MIFWRQVFETAGAAFGVLTVLIGAIVFLFRRHFDAQVLESLKRERARFRELLRHDFLVAEIKMGADTHERARRTHEAVEAYVADFKALAAKIEPRITDLLVVGKTVVDLDSTLHELAELLERFREDFNRRDSQRAADIAELRGHIGKGRRA